MSVNIFALLSIVSGVLILSLGVFVFDQNRKSPQHIIFLFLCGVASWWAFAESMMLGAESFATAGFWMKATALWTFVPPLALNFIVVFTRPDSWKNERWIYPILYAPALIFCWIELTSSLITTAPIQAFGGYVFGYSRQSLLPLVEISWGVIIAILAMLLCVQFYFTTTDHRKKQQAKYIIAGIGITAAFGILTQQMLPGLQFPIPDLTSASFLCFTGCVGYAIWKYRLFILNPATVADNILSTMTDGVVILDPEGNIVATNQALSTMVGTVKEQCVGRPVSDLFYHESDKATIVAMILAQGSLSDYETTFRSEEGRAIPVSFSGSVIRDTDGSVAGFVGVSRDITERKRAEEALQESENQYRNLIETTGTGYVIIDKDGRVIMANPEYVRLTGRSTLAEIQGRPVTDWTAPYDVERNAQEVENCSRTGQVRNIEIDYIKPDGTIQPVEVNATVIQSGAGVRILTLVRDITERKRADEALTRARKKLNVLNAITFSDIQTTIFSLRGYLELEKSVPAGERQQRFIDREIELVQVIADSLKYAELFQSLGLKSPVWQNVGQSFLLGISHLDISHLSRRLDVEHVEVYADPMLEHVFLALADNIREHAPTATEYSFTYTENLQGLVLVFKDNGPGIPVSLKEKIFEREYCRRNEIGLYLSREILSITGISIRETGEEGKGARFEILVPPGAWRKTRQP
jgi:PAS domain S-box-containing protein